MAGRCGGFDTQRLGGHRVRRRSRPYVKDGISGALNGGLKDPRVGHDADPPRLATGSMSHGRYTVFAQFRIRT